MSIVTEELEKVLVISCRTLAVAFFVSSFQSF